MFNRITPEALHNVYACNGSFAWQAIAISSDLPLFFDSITFVFYICYSCVNKVLLLYARNIYMQENLVVTSTRGFKLKAQL